MAKTIKEDQNSTWTINGDSKTWTLQEQATITVNGTAAIDVLNTSLANKLNLFGDIVASGDGGQGVHVSGVNTKIVVGKQAEINADEGIDAAANGLRVVNKGEIDGLHYGIANSSSSTIKNLGDISGDVAISTLGTSKVMNGEDGMIQGDFAGVIMAVGNGSELINNGLISGNDFAIRMLTGGENSIVNTGTIHGDILFGIGDDLLDSMKGTIEGTVSGGGGDDVYKIGKNEIALIEDNDDGIDTVYSTRSHELADNFENLYLMGKRNSSAVGNDEDNILFGNKGRNTLSGGAGDDEITGGRGDDAMSGGDGNDMFIFNKGDDHDSIVDFVDGQDTIQLGGFEGVTNFEELQFEMFKNGSDVWIQLGGGDRLIIHNTDVSELDASDFSFVA
jgi:Ca2+-binding RTX toxin-like protein